MGLTKSQSSGLKGFAIIIMMFHHCFYEPARYKGFEVNFFPFTESAVNDVTLYFKICVSIFAFITGFGLYLSYSKATRDEMLSWTRKRILKTFSGFWFIYLLVFLVTLPIGYPLDVYLTGSKTEGIIYAVVDFLGLANLFDTPTLNATWWYMSAALVFICAVPLLYHLENKVGSIAVIVLIVALPRILGLGYLGGINAYSFILAVFAGMLFAKHHLFERFDNFAKTLHPALVFIVLSCAIVLSVFIWIEISRAKFWEYHFALAPIIMIVYVRRFILCIPYINGILEFLGTHSMNIFLVHTFIRAYFFMDWTYSFDSLWLIPTILLLESLFLSIVIELLKKAIRYDRLIAKIL